MKIQEALDTIDDMIRDITAAQQSRRDRCTCTDREYYDQMDAENDATVTRYEALRDAIERGIDY